MRSLNSLLILVLSFVSFVISGPLHSTTHSSRLAKNHVSSRQFHYPRALVDVCADVDLSLGLGDILRLNLGSLLGDICLCLSAFPLDLDAYADLKLIVDLLGETKVEALLKTLIEDNGSQCTYPDHASPKCTSGNPCDFTCIDGFIKEGGKCVCSSPNSVCNGKCGSYKNGCSSALPTAPKTVRRSAISSRKPSGSFGLNLGGLLDGLLGSSGTTPDILGIDIDTLVNGVLTLLDVKLPISGGDQSSGLEVDLDICIGAGISGTESLLKTITDVVNSLLSSLLGTTLDTHAKSSCSSPVDSKTISVDIQVCGLLGDSFASTLDQTLKAVTGLLNNLLGDVNISAKIAVDGTGCPATPTLPSSSHPHPSPSTSVKKPRSVSPSRSSDPISSIDLGGLLDGLLGQVEGTLGDLGLSLGDYNLDTDVNLTVDVSIGLGSIGGLLDTVIALVDEILDSLLGADVTVRLNPNPTPSSASSNHGQGGGIVVDIGLDVVLDALLSDTGKLVDAVLSGVSGVLANLLNLDVTVNIDGGRGSRKAGAGK